jgi:predicted component of type VI protein secretion system
MRKNLLNCSYFCRIPRNLIPDRSQPLSKILQPGGQINVQLRIQAKTSWLAIVADSRNSDFTKSRRIGRTGKEKQPKR